MVASFLVAGMVRAESLKVTVKQGDSVRFLQARREGGELFLPLLACGPLLGADGRWDPATNRWSLRSRGALASGFLDEPLVTVSGSPMLVRIPPRLLGGQPYLSLETVRLLGRRGWETDVTWDEARKELAARAGQAQAESGAEATRARALKPPAVPAGSRVVALDPGHARRSGATGLRGLNEGDLGLALAQAVAATILGDGIAAVLLQDGTEALEPSEVASMANTLQSRSFVSFHASQWGDPGVTLWIWGSSNMAGAGIAFDPFEPPGGWTSAAQAQTEASLSLARRISAAMEAEGIEVRGPLYAPLLALEGLACPAVAVELEGIGTPPGARLATDEAYRGKLAAALAGVLASDLAAGTEKP